MIEGDTPLDLEGARMHALTSPITAGAPRVWLVTRQPARRAARPATALAVTRVAHPVVACIVFALVAVALLSGIILSRGVQFFLIEGDGLEPSIPSGSLIVVEPAGDRMLAVGEIITMSDDDEAPVSGYVTEVIHGVDGGRYKARALGAESGEPRVLSPSARLGHVALFVPRMADVVEIITGNVGRAGAVALALLVALLRVLSATRRSRARRGKALVPRQPLSGGVT
jgi:signal peptidase I